MTHYTIFKLFYVRQKSLILCFVLLSGALFSQEESKDKETPDRRISSKISDCDGAVKFPISGTFSVAFPGEPGIYADIDKYKDNFKYNQQNSVWLKFDAEFSGVLDLTIDCEDSEVEVGIFQLKPSSGCNEILLGKANLVHTQVLGKDPVSFNKESFPFMNIDKDSSKLFFYFNTTAKKAKNIRSSISYRPENIEKATKQLISAMDLRTDFSKPTYTLSVRDEETKLPVMARIVIDESKSFDALYHGSDIHLTFERTLKYTARFDAVGYFPKDTSFRVRTPENTNHIVYMTPVSFGKQVELEGIEFLPQSSTLTQDAQGKLIRLRDFLALNASVKVEIQGHVHQLGRNTLRSRWLSRKRARTVRRYLIQSGIDKSRVSFKGYGNEHMLYPEPETTQEEAANRRVEVKIL